MAQVSMAQVGKDQVGPVQIDMAQVGTAQANDHFLLINETGFFEKAYQFSLSLTIELWKNRECSRSCNIANLISWLGLTKFVV